VAVDFARSAVGKTGARRMFVRNPMRSVTDAIVANASSSSWLG